MTEARLRNIAFAYVQRYGGSSQRLEQVLSRRAERSLRYHEELERLPEVKAWVRQVVQRFQGEGISDDHRNARAAAIDLSLQGRPRRAIAYRLRGKGYAPEAIEAALSNLQSEELDPDWVACCRYARRRGLGPFSATRSRTRSREQQLASLMRAGFGFDHARRVLDATDADELEAVIAAAPTASLAGP